MNVVWPRDSFSGNICSNFRHWFFAVRPYAVRGWDTSVRDDLFKGLKIHDIDGPSSNNVQEYLAQGLVQSQQGI